MGRGVRGAAGGLDDLSADGIGNGCDSALDDGGVRQTCACHLKGVEEFMASLAILYHSRTERS